MVAKFCGLVAATLQEGRSSCEEALRKLASACVLYKPLEEELWFWMRHFLIADTTIAMDEPFLMWSLAAALAGKSDLYFKKFHAENSAELFETCRLQQIGLSEASADPNQKLLFQLLDQFCNFIRESNSSDMDSKFWNQCPWSLAGCVRTLSFHIDVATYRQLIAKTRLTSEVALEITLNRGKAASAIRSHVETWR